MEVGLFIIHALMGALLAGHGAQKLFGIQLAASAERRRRHTRRASSGLTVGSSAAVARTSVRFPLSRARRKRAYEPPLIDTNRCSQTPGSALRREGGLTAPFERGAQPASAYRPSRKRRPSLERPPFSRETEANVRVRRQARHRSGPFYGPSPAEGAMGPSRRRA
jgi:hypothetical protein